MTSQPSSNGFPHRRIEKEAGMKKPYSVTNTENGGEVGNVDCTSRDRLVYLTTCQTGHRVEVHLKNGSVYSGVFHAADVEKDFGIILKMALLIKDGNSRGGKSRKPPSKTLIIPAAEIVEVIAKDLPVYSNDGLNHEKSSELLTDSSISQSYHVDLERELKPWVPDEDVPEFPDLDNVFDDSWKRGWNQFEVNKTLFGVTSTFDEELYTTKLERGPRTRELEEQALRIAREIEGENTRDLHVAEERGLQLTGKFDMDEETKYSSVCPVNGFDDSGYEEEEEILLDGCNNLTFGDSSASDGKKPVSTSKAYEDPWGGSLPSRNSANVDQSNSISNKHAWQHMFGQPSKDPPAPSSNLRNESQLGEQRNNKGLETSHNKRRSEESVSGLDGINEDAVTTEPSRPQQRASERQSSTEGRPVGQYIDQAKSNISSGWSAQSSTEGRPVGQYIDQAKSNLSSGWSAQSSTEGRPVGQYIDQAKSNISSGWSAQSSTEGRPVGQYIDQAKSGWPKKSENSAASSASNRAKLSPSSSIGSLSSEKSTLNPNAKEFKLNPNAKSFKPSSPAARPQSPVLDGSFYYPPVPQFLGIHVGHGMGAAYPGQQQQQPMMYNNTAQLGPNQAYYPPNGPQYPQQMMVGQQRPVLFMPPSPYQPEMPYKGRDSY